MVDPKRHINILSEEDQLFINECEEEFKDRFTDNDDDFKAYCAQPSRPPPIVDPWQNRNFHGSGNHGGHYRGGRGGRGRYNNDGRHHHNRNYHPYNNARR